MTETKIIADGPIEIHKDGGVPALPVGPFAIDLAASDGQYLYVDIPSRGITATIKIEDEGIVVDLWPISRMADESIASTYAFSHEAYEGCGDDRAKQAMGEPNASEQDDTPSLPEVPSP